MNGKLNSLLTWKGFIIFMVLLLALTGCKKTTAAPTATQPAPTLPPPTETQPPEPTAAPSATPEPTQAPPQQTDPNVLPAKPQRVEFQTEDGVNLVGYYYPASVYPAPAVILMHWAGGDERDWLAIAPWLQNRPEELAAFPGWEAEIGADCEEQLMGPWMDPSWFPPMLKDKSFAVFTFDFRDFCESKIEQGVDLNWVLDAVAAFKTVSELPGVDPEQIVALGASIGADGAPDGCSEYIKDDGTCLGGFSLSPGDYLGLIYSDVVTHLDGEGIPVWCLAGKDDPPATLTCLSATGLNYVSTLYEEGDHGMFLLRPELDPNPMVLILDFLKEAFDIEVE